MATETVSTVTAQSASTLRRSILLFRFNQKSDGYRKTSDLNMVRTIKYAFENFSSLTLFMNRKTPLFKI